jgi:hypothetical protein
MVLNPFVEQRRIMKIKLMELMKQNQEIEEEKLIALFSLKTGLKVKTIETMMNEIKAVMEQETKEEAKT